MTRVLGSNAEVHDAGVEFDAVRTLASAAALQALDTLVSTLRNAGYANSPREDVSPATAAAIALALGHRVPRRFLEVAHADALLAAGAADLVDGEVAPRFMIFASGLAMVLVPRDRGGHPARVYFGQDSMWLADIAARLDVRGGWHADLGTGTGAVMALLGGRYDHAVGTDLLPRTAASAAITARLNRRADGRPLAGVVVADVAEGLRPGRFTLVTANPPWVPSLRFERAFADGGPSGFDLPRRFVMSAAQLLAPGGIAITLVLDATWDDGTRPAIALARGLRRLGYETAMQPTPGWPELEGDLVERVPGLRTARHVALLVRRC